MDGASVIVIPHRNTRLRTFLRALGLVMLLVAGGILLTVIISSVVSAHDTAVANQIFSAIIALICVVSIYVTYRQLLVPLPETLSLTRDALNVTIGSMPETALRHEMMTKRNTSIVLATLFPKTHTFDAAQMKTLALSSDGKDLTMRNGACHVAIAQGATSSDREWVYAFLVDYYK